MRVVMRGTGGNGADRDDVVTLFDVARLAGVSTATVSRVVHGQDRVRETTRIRVRQAIETLGYVPDGAAQSLSRRRKEVIGMACMEREEREDDIENVGLLYNDEVLRGVERRIRAQRWLLLLTFMQADGTPDFPRLDSLSGKVDGILLAEGFVASDYVERLAARVPVVVIAGFPSQQSADVVAADNFSGSVAIITHLIAEHVLRGNPHCQLVGSAQGIFSVRSGERAGEDLLARHRGALPDAVVCGNDQMAMGVLRVFAAAGVRVPEEVAVVGFDDIYPSSLYDPPLTTVHQPMRMLGEQACARVLERIADPSLLPAVELLPTELVLRSSCGCPPGTVTRRPVESARACHPAPAAAKPGHRTARVASPSARKPART